MKKIIVVLLCGVLIWFYNPKIKLILSNEELQKEVKASSENQDSKTNNTSINNFKSIKLGISKEELLSQIGKPSRIDESEYGFKWYVYNQYKSNFAMVGIEDDVVVALYSNSINSCEMENILLNHNREEIRIDYEPLEFKKKGNTRYIINSDGQYDVIKVNKKYITIFYDIYNDNKVCSYQIINENIEANLDGIYSKESEDLKRSFELEVIDLTNSVREKKGLKRLQYSDKATISAQKHSIDMEQKNYFDHKDKNNKTPFDRMKDENIVYRGAGENIAAGQTSAIYAHEAWMNSKGHRKNILGDYMYIGVGVEFGGHYNIYYTQNFYI
ncbi:CAP-associated domain-containing protein [Romboutsia sp.]|uniref:CAP domain-containing protein n=1 Tax=Romboutsia sp. TaxID=1965302 RepID=UPI003F2D80E5